MTVSIAKTNNKPRLVFSEHGVKATGFFLNETRKQPKAGFRIVAGG